MPSKPRSLPGSGPGILLVLLLILGFVLGVSWLIAGQWQTVSSREALAKQRAHATRLYHLDELLLKMIDAESGIRGYVLTNNPVYLTPYQNGRAEVDNILRLLGASTDWQRAEHRELFESLPGLYDRRWEIMRQRLEGESLPESDSAAGGPGKQVTDEIRHVVSELRAQTLEEIDRTLLNSFSRFSDLRDMNRILGAGVLVLLLWLVITLYRQEKLRGQLAFVMRSENERLQAEVEARTAELTNLATYLTNARELESARLARELHDELGALMTAAKLDAGWIARKLPDEVMVPLRSRFDRLISTLNEVIAIKRRVVADLRPPLLSDLGLVEALRSLAQAGGVGEAEGEVDLDLPQHIEELPPQLSLALFRIAQESLTNVRRHAHATRTQLSLAQEADMLVLKVEDNGVGFDPGAPGNNRHGLAGMAHRVQMLTGSLTVESSPGKGTVVIARIPWRDSPPLAPALSPG